MRCFLGSVVVIGLARVASAGECDANAMADVIDARAAKAQPPAEEGNFNLCLSDLLSVWQTQPKLTKRLLASCEKILTKRPGDEVCASAVAILGKEQWGKTDIVATLAAKISDPSFVIYLGNTNSPRVAPLVIAKWKRQQPIADKKPNDSDVQNEWAAWRVAACDALGATGDAAAKEFLTDQIGHKIDRGVKHAAARAIEAIDKRSH